MAKNAPTPVADALRRFRREELQTNQAGLAKILGVSLSTIAKWETGKTVPSAMACKELARQDKKHRQWWVKQAGEFYDTVETGIADYKRRRSHVYEDMLIVPILTSVIAAGHPAEVEDLVDEYEGSIAIPIPKGSVIPPSSLIAARVRGTSMEPRIMDGSIVIIDTRQDKPEDNVGFVVAARNENGITVKTLMREKGLYLLVASNPDYSPLIQAVDTESRWDIAGRVVNWIGEPRQPAGK